MWQLNEHIGQPHLIGKEVKVISRKQDDDGTILLVEFLEEAKPYAKGERIHVNKYEITDTRRKTSWEK